MSIPPRDLLFHVSSAEEGKRLDTYLSAKVIDYSRSQFKQWIKEGCILVCGERMKASYAVRSGDTVLVKVPGLATGNVITPEAMALNILYEDDLIIVIDKPAGLVVHPGAGHEEGTLIHGLLAHCRSLAMQGAPLRPGIVHRLDRNTSGALIIAKTEKAYLDLIRQFKTHSVRKIYLAIVYGRFPKKDGEVRTFIGRHPEDRKKMTVLEKPGREAVTRWSVERELGEVTLLRIRLETGRTHQIRVHMNHIQHPVVGDATYGGGKRRTKGLKSKELRDLLVHADRQMLHAWQLVVEHPGTRQSMSFEAPLPADFECILGALENLHGYAADIPKSR